MVFRERLTEMDQQNHYSVEWTIIVEDDEENTGSTSCPSGTFCFILFFGIFGVRRAHEDP
jgi:hypothetical protein